MISLDIFLCFDILDLSLRGNRKPKGEFMALYKEQLHPDWGFERNPGKDRKWIKNQHNRWIRRKAKDIAKDHPKTNRYKGWAD